MVLAAPKTDDGLSAFPSSRRKATIWRLFWVMAGSECLRHPQSDVGSEGRHLAPVAWKPEQCFLMQQGLDPAPSLAAHLPCRN